MWPDKDLAERVARDYVPVIVDVDKDKATPKKYGVTAMPTLVIADVKENTLVKQVGAPFQTPAAAMAWFDKITTSISALPDLEKKFAAGENKDLDAATALAKAYSDLGRSADAIKTYEAAEKAIGEDSPKLVAMRLDWARALIAARKPADALAQVDKAEKALEEGDARATDVKLLRAEVLTATRDITGAEKLLAEIAPSLKEAKDARYVDVAIKRAEIADMRAGRDADKAKEAASPNRESLLEAAKLFPSHDRIRELKVRAAWYAIRAGDNETAKAELDAIIAAGPENDQWVGIAQNVRNSIKE